MAKTRLKELRPKQAEFLAKYLEFNMNAKKAARVVGYSYPQALNLIHDPRFIEATEAFLDQYAMGAKEVLFRLSMQARASMEDFLTVNEATGEVKFNFTEAMRDNILGTIKKISIKPTEFGDSLEVELYDAQSALVHLGRYHKLFTDKVQIADWRTDAIESIRAGSITYEALKESLDANLAEQLFREAGVAVKSSN